MKEIAKQAGLTVRAALQSWPETIRLAVLIVVGAAIWYLMHHFG